MNAVARAVQSLWLRLALIPVTGVVVMRVSESALPGLAAAIAVAVAVVCLDRAEDR